MNVIKDGVETQVSTIAVAEVLKKVIPDWAIREALEHITMKRVNNEVVNLDKIGGAETNYRVIDLDTAIKLCSDKVVNLKEDDPDILDIIKSNLDGHLQSYEHEEGVDFLITIE